MSSAPPTATTEHDEVFNLGIIDLDSSGYPHTICTIAMCMRARAVLTNGMIVRSVTLTFFNLPLSVQKLTGCARGTSCMHHPLNVPDVAIECKPHAVAVRDPVAMTATQLRAELRKIQALEYIIMLTLPPRSSLEARWPPR